MPPPATCVRLVNELTGSCAQKALVEDLIYLIGSRASRLITYTGWRENTEIIEAILDPKISCVYKFSRELPVQSLAISGPISWICELF